MLVPETEVNLCRLWSASGLNSEIKACGWGSTVGQWNKTTGLGALWYPWHNHILTSYLRCSVPSSSSSIHWFTSTWNLAKNVCTISFLIFSIAHHPLSKPIHAVVGNGTSHVPAQPRERKCSSSDVITFGHAGGKEHLKKGQEIRWHWRSLPWNQTYKKISQAHSTG